MAIEQAHRVVQGASRKAVTYVMDGDTLAEKAKVEAAERVKKTGVKKKAKATTPAK